MPAEHEIEGQQKQSSGQLILLVEDNLHNRRIFAGILRHFGYRVEEAIDGEEGITMTRSLRPDLVLMDLSLPILDGWEATRRLKADPELKHIPVVALTAHAMAGDEARALQAGCDAYLSKPISPKHLAAEVQRLLQELAR